jgi:phenylacetate-CoA ligase
MLSLRKVIATRVLDPIIWKRKRMPIGIRLREFRVQQWDPPEVFEERQARKLADLLAHTVTRIPYYRERLPDLAPEAIREDPSGSLRAFPVLERETVHDHLDDLHVDMGRGVIRDHTSGSTGMPLNFIRDRESVGAGLATTQLCQEWAGVERGDRRTRLWGAAFDLKAARAPARRFLNAFYARTVLDCYEMSEEVTRRYVDFLNRRPPLLLEGYPSAIYEVAVYAERHGLEVPTPRAISASGAMLYDHMKEKIEEVFRAPVFNHYGNREIGLLTAECERHEGMHVCGETALLEIVDDNNVPVPDGEEGDILATHFWNHTMPFIRYRTGDRGVMATKKCSCGRVYPALASVIGRTGACFVRRDGSVMIPEFFVQLFAWEIDSANVRKFQLVQEDVDRITVNMVPQPDTEGYSEDERAAIRRRLAEGMRGPVDVGFVAVDDIPQTQSGKYRYTVSKVVDADRSG